MRIRVTTYAELEEFFRAFASGRINLLIVESDGGLGKTHTAEKMIKGGYFIRGHATPLSIYLKLGDEDPDLVVFDDVETLLRNRHNTTLLKQILDTKEVKTVCYHTTARINDAEVPHEIKIKSKAMILCNDLHQEGKDIKALLSRGHYIHFEPTKEEILGRIKTFATDNAVVSEIEGIINKMANLSLRTYVKAVELKKAGMDWRQYLYRMSIEDADVCSYLDERARHPRMAVKNLAQVWCKRTGKSERTFYNVRQRAER